MKKINLKISIEQYAKAGFDITQDEEFLYIKSCINIRDECFYKITDDEIVIFGSDEYAKLMDSNETILDYKNINYFIKNYVFPTGETGIDGVKRIEPNSKYSFHRKTLTIDSTRIDIGSDLGQRKYVSIEIFDKTFQTVLHDKIKKQDGKNVGVLFSGGVDSIYIVISLLRMNIRPILLTFKPSPAFDSSEIDIVRSEYCGKLFELEHYFVETHIDKNKLISYWKNLKREMPMAVHTGIFFDELIQFSKIKGIKILISGQNADTFYNFGPTSKFKFDVSSMADTFRRFFLTDFIISALNQNQKGFINKLKKNLAIGTLNIGAYVYQLLKKDGANYRRPRNAEEAYEAYVNRPDYTIFPEINKIQTATCAKQNFEFYSEIITHKIYNFITSGAPMVIHNTALRNEIESITPFSEREMLNLFSHLNRNIGDVIYPKKYIYRSIIKYRPDLLVNLEKLEKGIAGPNYHKWLNDNLDYFSTSNDSIQGGNYNSATNFMRKLANFWIEK